MKRKLLTFCTLFVLLGSVLMFLASNHSSGQAHAAATGLASPTPTKQAVSIVNYTYLPATVTIKVGTIVVWKNKDFVAHTITSDDGKTFNHVIASGGTYRFKFTKAGTFPYHCNFHTFMKATIVVK